MQVREAVVVVTGASSGIGRATALLLAQRGAKLVLTARDRDALATVAAVCGNALAVAADVTKETEVEAVARRAFDAYGRIDAWLNIAAVYLVGRFEDVPAASFRRVLETNFFGMVNGARTAMACFRRQGGGILVNVSSVSGVAPQPYATAYTASKFAVRGFSSALRMELAAEGMKGIHVCTVLPAAIDTPIFQHAANYSGRAARALDPTYDAEDVAKAIARLLEKPKRETIVGRLGHLITRQASTSLAAHEKLTNRYYKYDQFQPGRPAPATDGNLFRTAGPKSVSGGWKAPARRRRVGIAVAAGVLGMGLYALRRKQRPGTGAGE